MKKSDGEDKAGNWEGQLADGCFIRLESVRDGGCGKVVENKSGCPQGDVEIISA